MPYDPERHGPHRIVGPGFHEDVYRIVREVPRGRVTTYGDVAEALGSRHVARHVGNAMAAIPRIRRDVPWHRVVNAQGRISRRNDGDGSLEQERLLDEEGITVDAGGRIVEFATLRYRPGG
ncbi:MAG: MGMT family protein [Planctomycetes bacterium]|nr:MGMT family protein [Planctomycetota bacterium]